MFESLKKKFTGTIGKISDKITEEEELESSETKISETTEKSEVPDESFKGKFDDKSVKEVQEESESTSEPGAKKSGFMGFLRGRT